MKNALFIDGMTNIIKNTNFSTKPSSTSPVNFKSNDESKMTKDVCFVLLQVVR